MTIESPLRTLVLTLAVALVSGASLAQDLCAGLVTDKVAHPMTPLAKPGVGQTVTDPQFGTKIRRLTAAPAGGAIRPMYSTISAWNADETRLILYRVGSGHELYDGKTYAFIRELDISPADIEQVYWDTSDPDLFYYVDNYFGPYPHQASFVRYRVSTGAKQALREFTFCSSSVDVTGGSDPMYIAWDKKRIGLRCGSEHFIYDFGTDTIVKRKTMSGGYEAVQMAPSGNLAYLDGKVLDTNLNTVRTLDLGNPWEHATLGKLANGNDAYFGVAFDEGPKGSDVGSLVLHDMTNGNWRVVVGPATGYPYPPSGTHVSAMAHKRPGWVVVSGVANLDGQGVLDNELLLANTAPGGAVCRLAHHRSYGKSGSMGYWAEPHPVPSPSGTRILFGSDWGNSGSVDSYVIELPSYGGNDSFRAASLTVDTTGNSVLEPGETASMAPSWRNVSGASGQIAGTLTAFTGPGGLDVDYAITDGAANYGTVAAGATAGCAIATGNCYALLVSVPTTRPAGHWDATVVEQLSEGSVNFWSLHIGDTFDDVPRGSPFYRYVETLLHRSVTSGCSATRYCPTSSSTRAQMAVFALRGKEGGSYTPPGCAGTPAFADVPNSSPFCPWIEELARRGVVAGCGSGRYCPDSPVTREQMAVYMLRTLDPEMSPPACSAPVFDDVPAADPFCRWIEELARRGVVAGCASGRYCPDAPVNREQMSVFIGKGFDLDLYGP